MIEIKSRFTGEVIFKADVGSIKLAVEAAVKAGASLDGANLYGANLNGASLDGASLDGANLNGANLYGRSVCPPSGAFIAWKKCEGDHIVKLQIPAWARRVSALCGRKCRAEFAIVLSIEKDGKSIHSCRGQYDPDMVYEVGKIMKPDEFDPDRRVECSHGIHFFMEYDEAKEY